MKRKLKTKREVAEAVLDLFSDGRRFCQGPVAVNARGRAVDVDSRAAVAFCSAGAVWRLRVAGVITEELRKESASEADRWALKNGWSCLATASDYGGLEVAREMWRSLL